MGGYDILSNKVVEIMRSTIILCHIFSFINFTIVIGCPDGIGWIPAGESCYRISTEAMNWFESQQYCAEIGGYLGEIQSAEETQIINELIGTDLLYWIGLSDNAEYGKWIWQHSYTPVDYTNWESSQPNFLETEHCALLCWGGQWCDFLCDHKNDYIPKPIHAFCEGPNQFSIKDQASF